jgi:acetyl esterase/lipase
MNWDLYPAADPKAPCFVHIHGGYWQRGSKQIFACLAEGALANGWSAALPGYTLACTSHRSRASCDQRLTGLTPGAPNTVLRDPS